MPTVFVGTDRQRVQVGPSDALASGGEADVYKWRGGSRGDLLKLYRLPTDPNWPSDAERQNARERLAVHQRKLPAFPRGLPDRVVSPIELVYDAAGMIVGYSMAMVKGGELLAGYGKLGEPLRAGIDGNVIGGMYLDLHATVTSLQPAIVIGDFNDLNELVVDNSRIYLIDADSWQFGPFLCNVFTSRYVDPLLVRPTTARERADNPNIGSYILVRPHSAQSDWYAYSVMLFSSLLGVDPYGGVFKPKDRTKAVPHSERPLHRITVFSPEVMYPKLNALHYSLLPDELLDYFRETFAHDRRQPFPVGLLQAMRWARCIRCGAEHARTVCPVCALAAPAAVTQREVRHGKVTATRVFETRGGMIVYAAMQEGRLRYLYVNNGGLYRENERKITDFPLQRVSSTRLRISGESTLVASKDRLLKVEPDGTVIRQEVDDYGGNLPVFDANANQMYWVNPTGSLLREGPYSPEVVGDVLPGQTLFWVGPTFGFGFYRAGSLQMAFVFETEDGQLLNDTVTLPRWQGQLVDSTAVFSSSRCWFFATVKERSRIVNHCYVINAAGTVEASAEVEAGDPLHWLGAIRGKAATGDSLYVPTDDGVKLLKVQGGQIVEKAVFPDTGPFVGQGDNLFVGKDGIYVVGRSTIYRLTMSST